MLNLSLNMPADKLGMLDAIAEALQNVSNVVAVVLGGSYARGFARHDSDIDICVPLYDPEGEIARLKKSVAEYPEPLKNRIVQDSLWGAELSLRFCRIFATSADVYNAVGCMTRVAQCLVHGIFALNEEYFVSDKHAGRLLEQFVLRPRDFTLRLERALSNPGCDPAELRTSSELLGALWFETVELTAGTYKPRFDLRSVLPDAVMYIEEPNASIVRQTENLESARTPQPVVTPLGCHRPFTGAGNRKRPPTCSL